MRGTPKTIDRYLASLPLDQRAVLERLRKAIKAAAPEAEECISYQLPSFRLKGRWLVAFGAARKHCALYPGAAPIAACREELAGYRTSKGTIRFDPKRPLPASLVRKLVGIRVRENATRERQAASRAARQR